MRNEVVALVGS